MNLKFKEMKQLITILGVFAFVALICTNVLVSTNSIDSFDLNIVVSTSSATPEGTDSVGCYLGQIDTSGTLHRFCGDCLIYHLTNLKGDGHCYM